MAERNPKRNLIGQEFDRLTVVKFVGRNRYGHALWLCDCTCGGSATVSAPNLRRTHSCGCFQRETAGDQSRIHGRNGTLEWNSWRAMKERCFNPKADRYDRYGGRGITVCERWLEFAAFYADMGPRPSANSSIERKDNDPGYWCGHCADCISKGWEANCRWAAPVEQARNSDHVHELTFNGVTRCISEWAEIARIDRRTIHTRLRDGWSIEDALTRPPRIWPPKSAPPQTVS